MVVLDVQLEVFVESIGFQEAHDSGAIEVILMLGGFARLRKNVEIYSATVESEVGTTFGSIRNCALNPIFFL